MGLGPVFAYEMVTSVRRARHWWLRVLYGGVMLLILWATYRDAWTYLYAISPCFSIQHAAYLASRFFEGFCVIQMLAVLLVTPPLVVGAISGEFERRTVDYLLSSDLSTFEILAGKIGVRLLHVAMLLLVGLPVLALAMQLGGIDPARLLKSFSSTLAVLLLLTAMSAAVATRCHRVREAVTRVYVIEMMFMIIPAVTYYSIPTRGLKPSAWQNALAALVAASPLAMISTDGWPTRPFGWLLFSYAITTAALLAWTGWSFRRAAAGPRAARRVPRLRMQDLLPSTAAMLDRWPILWKECIAAPPVYGRGLFARALIVAILAATAWLVVYPAMDSLLRGSNSTSRDDAMSLVVGTQALFSCAAVLLIGAHAACLTSGERERDTWTSLMMTDVTPRDTILAKMAGAGGAARWPLAIVGGMYALTIWLDTTALFYVPAAAISLAIVSGFAACLGLRLSMRMRSSTQAMVATLAVLGALGLGYVFIGETLFNARPDEPYAYSACPPWLLIFPIMAWERYFRNSSFSMLERNAVPFVAGLVLYVVVTIIMTCSLIRHFDRLAGRAIAFAARVPPPIHRSAPHAASTVAPNHH